MNAQTEQVFREARAAHKNTASTVSTQPPDYLALSILHTNEMQRLAAPAKVADILYSYAPSRLSAVQRWERLPETSRKILANYQAAGGGSYVPVPNDTKEIPHD
jgi:hypothetical protein